MVQSSAVENRIHGIEGLLDAQRLGGLPPVEKWDPPYRGDIGLAIKADGTWLYQGSIIQRPALARLFSRVLRRDDDGKHYLVTPVERVDVAVEDAPFLAVEMQVEGAEPHSELIFRTNVDDVVRCGGGNPLRFVEERGSGGLKPYVLVRGRLEALVTRAVCYDLVELAIRSEARPAGVRSEQPGVWSCGIFFPVEAVLDGNGNDHAK